MADASFRSSAVRYAGKPVAYSRLVILVDAASTRVIRSAQTASARLPALADATSNTSSAWHASCRRRGRRPKGRCPFPPSFPLGMLVVHDHRHSHAVMPACARTRRQHTASLRPCLYGAHVPPRDPPTPSSRLGGFAIKSTPKPDVHEKTPLARKPLLLVISQETKLTLGFAGNVG